MRPRCVGDAPWRRGTARHAGARTAAVRQRGAQRGGRARSGERRCGRRDTRRPRVRQHRHVRLARAQRPERRNTATCGWRAAFWLRWSVRSYDTSPRHAARAPVGLARSMRAPASPAREAPPLARSPSTPSWLLLPRATPPLRGRCRTRTTDYESISGLPRAAWPSGDGGTGGWGGAAVRRAAALALLLAATSAAAAVAGYALAFFPLSLEARRPRGHTRLKPACDRTCSVSRAAQRTRRRHSLRCTPRAAGASRRRRCRSSALPRARSGAAP